MKQLHNSSLLATAVAATLCLGAGNAAALEVNLYGVGHVSADNNNDGTDSQWYIASNSSRLGLKGSQKLSDNINAIFQYESGVDLTGRGTNDG
ncbi:MAG: porin, partial [Planctomycetia bacterium]|nr:porin [Planctomycetia bacterium]